MSIRLNKALRELNIGLQTAVEFLEEKSELGEVKGEPSFKLSDAQYQALVEAFQQDAEVRNQAEKIFQKKPKEKKKISNQKSAESKSLIDRIHYFLNLMKASKELVLNILNKIEIEDLTFKLKVGGSDPFETATHYGQASGAVYSAFSAICCSKKPINYEVNVSPDFISEKSSLVMNLDIKLRPIYMIYFLFKYVGTIKNLKYEGD